MKFITCCDCSDTPMFSRDAYKILFKGSPVPKLYTQKELHLLIKELPMDTEVHQYVEKLMKQKPKFSFFVHSDEDGNIIERWDLLAGRMVG